jgi:hypothetical protein
MGIKLKPFSLILMVLLVFSSVAFAQEAGNVPDTSLRSIDSLIVRENILDTIPIVSLDGEDIQDGIVQTISSSSRQSRDVFTSTAIFNFNALRFQARGYSGDNFTTYMNGVPMEDLASGYSSTSLWSGLSAETRNRYTTLGLHNNTFSFGDIGSSTFIDTRASKQRKQTIISFGRNDGLIRDITSLTYSTGMNKKGWAFTFSGDRRYSDNGYVQGTYYNGWGYFAGVDKKINAKQLLSLVVFGTPSESGAQGHATKEAFALAGSNYYNPDWGYQNGKIRNSRINKSNQPTGILTHDFSINKKTSLLTAVSYTFGNKSSSRIDYFDAPNPEPDYYSYLPSYYDSTSPSLASSLTTYFKSHPEALQVNWQNFYNVNRNNNSTVQNANGIAGNTVSGNRSLYVLGESVTNTQRFNFNTTLNTLLTNHINLTGGLSYQLEKNNYYKKIDDLLGGDFYLDVDQYAVQDFPNNPNSSQSDLNHPNRIVHVGDPYGYNYDIDINQATGWLQSAFHYKKVDFFVAAELSNTSFWRVGNYRNGLYPDSSYGKSSVNDFTNYAVKAGVTYKLEAAGYLYLNAGLLTKAPYFKDSYLDDQIKNTTQTNLQSQDVQTVEGGYVYNSPQLNLRLTGYYSTFKHGFNVRPYFDYSLNEFVDFATSNINTVQFGGELGAEMKVAKGLSVITVASVGRYYYDSRQLVTVTTDNNTPPSPQVPPPGTIVYTQNFRLPNTPQEAYSLGLNYRSRHFWGASLTGNYFDQMWSEPLPDRRTYQSINYPPYYIVDPKSTQWGDIINQEKFSGQFLLNLNAWRSWKIGNIMGIKKTYLITVSAGASNLLNNQNVVSNGYEGGRDYKFPTGTGVFPTKYTYADGITYFVRATVRFY